jgi:hypothetical protein
MRSPSAIRVRSVIVDITIMLPDPLARVRDG